jgi:mono/diheme cytochrome c family protein
MTEEPSTKTVPQTQVVGLVAEFDSPDALLTAGARIHREGYRKTDAFSPFPIHGIDEAMGIRPTVLPWLVLIAGLAGGLTALTGEWWISTIDYPMLISGKPRFSLPAHIPVVFELTILAAGVAAFLGMLALNQLPRWSNPLLRKAKFLRATTDRFFLMIEAADPKFDAVRTRALLESLQPVSIEVCEAETGRTPLPKLVVPVLLLMVCLALIPPALIARARVTKSDKPRWDTFMDMDYHPGFKPQTSAPASLFADRRSSRPPVAGTVARGSLNADDRLYRGIEPEAVPAAASIGGTSAMFTATADAADSAAEAGAEPADPAAAAEATETGPADGQTAPPATVDEEPQPPWVTAFPVSVTRELMARGRQRYDIYCATCHGLVGDGNGIVSKRALELEQGTWIPPLSLHVDSVVAQPVGQLYHTITHGVRKMPGYGDQLSVEDRWAVVLYIRALQRSRNASPADVPSALLDTLRDL